MIFIIFNCENKQYITKLKYKKKFKIISFKKINTILKNTVNIKKILVRNQIKNNNIIKEIIFELFMIDHKKYNIFFDLYLNEIKISLYKIKNPDFGFLKGSPELFYTKNSNNLVKLINMDLRFDIPIIFDIKPEFFILRQNLVNQKLPKYFTLLQKTLFYNKYKKSNSMPLVILELIYEYLGYLYKDKNHMDILKYLNCTEDLKNCFSGVLV